MRLGDYHALHLCRLDGLKGAGVGDMDSTVLRSKSFVVDIKLFNCRTTVLLPALSAHKPENTCQPVARVILKKNDKNGVLDCT